MSKSLALIAGDLNVTGRHYDTVRGKAKLIQDLTCFLIERTETDPATPDFGSQFETDAYIGNVYTDILATEARADIQELLQNYQSSQLEKIKNETIQYNGLNTLEDGEVIESIDSVQSTFSGTTLIVRVSLTVLSGETIKIDVPIDTYVYG